MDTAALYQEIAENAQKTAGARLVNFGWVDPRTGHVHVGASAGLGSRLIAPALDAVRRIVPGFDPSQISFPADINPWNKAIYHNGRSVAGPLRRIATGAIPQVLIELAAAVGLRHIYTCPLTVQRQVVGSLSFHGGRPFTAGQRRVCDAFARQASLTLENARLVEEQQQVLRVLEMENMERRRTEAELRVARTDLERRVAQRTAELSRANGLLAQEIAERRRAEEQLRLQAMRDPLTGLFNRRSLEESLERELHRAARQGSPLSAIMLDVDHFKQVNDAAGHLAGDMLLGEIAACLQRHIRAEDIACRFGGEEFLILLPGSPLNAACDRAEALRAEVARLRLVHGGVALPAVTLSAGVAVWPEHGATADALLRAADAALYQAKAKGRDRVVVAAAAGEVRGFTRADIGLSAK